MSSAEQTRPSCRDPLENTEKRLEVPARRADAAIEGMSETP